MISTPADKATQFTELLHYTSELLSGWAREPQNFNMNLTRQLVVSYIFCYTHTNLEVVEKWSAFGWDGICRLYRSILFKE